ncbi:50S ribosome-binding GTPase (macronuclear) [Tetrahymena thermophila SB210]|uniref:50S ribosome-binding GTPase n=1 Tax=Tetrahymena thermophila (strain SB210) TaxID=312017 RepID=Q23QG7_TETTS|nr:50S ribosome-binding GTPase [Tetrahymena thermophila SB210]EAR98921.2 50S ribosome-binding GTPase [Tetrahymena thermophila SB210]|eukprot:XP_001019166.2 50S ribosome-binding GTPase [Tetrahymena thermophila SB210]
MLLEFNIETYISELQKKGDNDSLSLFKILKDVYLGYEKIQIKEKRNSILLFGNSGSGKTSISAFLSGLDLRVVKDQSGFCTLDYAYVENQNYGKIGKNHIESETFIPNLFQNQQYGIDIWDLPGINDTRGEEIDIVNSYFIHKVINSVAGIKFVFVIDGHSLNSGLGPEKGKALKQIFEMLYMFTLNSQFDFAKNLIFIINKASKSFEFYKEKITKKFISEVVNSQDYQTQLKQNLQMVNIQEFFSRVAQAKILLIPVANESQVGNLFESRILRDQLLLEILQSEFYCLKDLRIPFTDKSLDKIKLMWSYSQDLVRVTFESICQTLASQAEQLNREQIEYLESVTLNLEQQYQIQESNLKKFLTIYNTLLLPFSDSIYITDKNDLQHNVQLLHFLISEIYDEVLINIELLGKDKQLLCRFGSQETRKGLEIIRMSLEYSKKILEKKEAISYLEIKVKQSDEIKKQMQQQQKNNQFKLDELQVQEQHKTNDLQLFKSKIRDIDQKKNELDNNLIEQRRNIEDFEKQKKVIDQQIVDAKKQVNSVEDSLCRLKQKNSELLDQTEKLIQQNKKYEEEIIQLAISQKRAKKKRGFLKILSYAVEFIPYVGRFFW